MVHTRILIQHMEFEIKRIHSTGFMKHSVEHIDNASPSPNLRDVHIERSVCIAQHMKLNTTYGL